SRNHAGILRSAAVLLRWYARADVTHGPDTHTACGTELGGGQYRSQTGSGSQHDFAGGLGRSGASVAIFSAVTLAGRAGADFAELAQYHVGQCCLPVLPGVYCHRVGLCTMGPTV